MKVWLSQNNSVWSFEPTRGFTIKNIKVNLHEDTAYFCTGTLDVIKGKRVKISEKKIDDDFPNFLKGYLPEDKLPITDFAPFLLGVIGTVHEVQF
jgi:hypothetical protein